MSMIEIGHIYSKAQTMATLTFKPKAVVKRLLGALVPRAKDVIIKRYGLGDNAEPMTLEAIGTEYGITRERVRQIENHALDTIRSSDAYKAEKEAFDILTKLVDELGGLVFEDEFLGQMSTEASTKNHLQFMLTVGESFTSEKEDDTYRRRWYVDRDLSKKIHRSLKALYESLSDEDLIPESEIISRLLDEVEDLNEKYKNDEIAKRWLGICKGVDCNPLGEWGKSDSPNVKTKGMRDYAYLAIKRHGSPMHFTEVAKAISELFQKKAHVATTHNELIKDDRFVLVGRGLYALKEWGYSTGVVKDVIKDLLKKGGAMTRDEIIDKVKKERYVKDNTIVVNLQDTKTFKRRNDGKYVLA